MKRFLQNVRAVFACGALTMLLATPSARAWSLATEEIRKEFAGGAVFFEKEARQSTRSVRIQGVRFSTADYTLKVVDNPDSSGGSLGGAMTSGKFIAGINGGYFHPDFRPIGLVVRDGETLHDFERAKLLSGVLGVDADGPHLYRNHEFQQDGDMLHALQSGPFLVDGGEPVAGLNDSKIARRTVIATDGRGGWLLAVISPVTLADAAEILVSKGMFPAFPIQRALNLDGGSSTGLWVDTGPRPFYLREFTPVRNYLGLAPVRTTEKVTGERLRRVDGDGQDARAP